MSVMPSLKRSIRVTSLSFNNQLDEHVWEAVKTAGSMQSDLIILPETWAGPEAIDSLDSPRVLKLRELAEKYGVYIVSGMYRKSENHARINSAILIGRSGKIEGIYDKVYPYWTEFDLNPPVEIGKKPLVFDTDFGGLGIAICFDTNFPIVWEEMAKLGARIIAWPSAYSAGTSLQAHALNYNYYIVTATLENDCTVYDITGKEILFNKVLRDDDILISSVVLDMDRSIFHQNFNGNVKKLLADNSDTIIQEQSLPREQWFVLKSIKECVSARELAKQYGLEELSKYKLRSREEQDRMREEM